MRILFILFFFFVGLTTFSQNVEFKANAPTVVELGEQFRLSYTLNSKGTNLQVPTFEGFDFLMGPSTSSSVSYSNVNGKMTQNASYTYTYVLEGIKKGKHQIPAATVTVNGKTYTSNSLTIEVVEGSGGQGNTQTDRRAAQPQKSAQVTPENLFLRLEVSRRNMFIGEPLVVTLKIYTKVDLVDLGQSKFPSFSGFLTEEIKTPQRISLERENYNGSVYNVGVLRKMLLFPQHTGEIVIEPFELECVVRQQLSRSRSFFDDFFGNYQDVRVKRKSEAVKIMVNELPHTGRPLGFGGTVGKVSMSTSMSADTVKVNEAITYKVVFSGSGNIKLLEAPVINFPPDFENYEPKVSKNITTDEKGMHGTISYEYLLIPRYAGDYKIPAVRFSYFDPQAKSFKSIAGKDYNIHVLKGEGRDITDSSQPAIQSFKKEEVRFLGEDIRYIKTGELKLHNKGSMFFKTSFYWLAFVIPFLLFIGGVLLNRRRIKANADLSKVKNRTANKMARKRLKVAASALKSKDSEAFYDEVLKALWGYVSYKLNIDRAELNRDNINDVLDRKSIESSLTGEFISILDECEFARYAPGGKTEEKMDEVYKKSISIIMQLDKVIK